MGIKVKYFGLSVAFCFIVIFSNSQVDISFEFLHGGYDQPVEISAPDDSTDRLFIVEKGGYIYIIENGQKVMNPFLDIHTIVNTENERGLLGLAFHPNYKDNGLFYIHYSNNSGNSVISRLEVSPSKPNLANLSSKKDLLIIYQPYKNHNGGDLNFSPIDGYLYIAMGDGGNGGDPECYAQDSTSFLGKILRLDVNQNLNSSPYYGIPPNNPYVNNTTVPNEVWAFGLRNPWRFSFDRKNGDLWISDVGQDRREEVNKVNFDYSGDLNFGWKVMEGDTCYDSDPIDIDCPTDIPSCYSNSYYEPLFTYPHDEFIGGYSITGGYVYRGCRYPNLYGKYLCIDYISRNFWIIEGDGSSHLFTLAPIAATSFGESNKGELYVASILGNIYKVKDNSIPESINLTVADLPLSIFYQALDSITIDLPSIDSNVEFKASKIKFLSNQNITSEAFITISEYSCDY